MPRPTVTFHEEPKDAAVPQEGSKGGKTKLPPIPDMRFEYSYLKSIQPFVRVQISETHGAEGEVAVRDGISRPERIEIEWRGVLWVTLKDQVLTPCMQGVIWGLAAEYIKPLGAMLGFGRARSTLKGPRKDGEGEGVSWLRNFCRKLGLWKNAQATT